MTKHKNKAQHDGTLSYSWEIPVTCIQILLSADPLDRKMYFKDSLTEQEALIDKKFLRLKLINGTS